MPRIAANQGQATAGQQAQMTAATALVDRVMASQASIAAAAHAAATKADGAAADVVTLEDVVAQLAAIAGHYRGQLEASLADRAGIHADLDALRLWADLVDAQLVAAAARVATLEALRTADVARLAALEVRAAAAERRLPFTARRAPAATGVLLAVGATVDLTLDGGRTLPTTAAADYIVTAVGTGALARALLVGTVHTATTVRVTIPLAVGIGQSYGIDVVVTARA